MSERKRNSVRHDTHKGLIHVDQITKKYLLYEVEILALREITLTIEQGEFTTLVGPSGSGKTTLLNLIGLLDTPTSGTIFFDGKDVSTLSHKQKQQIRLNEVGFVFQDFNLIPSLTALENVQLPLLFARKSSKKQQQCATELLERVGLTKRARHLPSQLSGGEKQRVAIARALANQPKVVLADEPTGNLDSTTAVEVFKLFRSLVDENRTIIVGTHNQELAKQADRIFLLRDGRIT
ncbi:MAG: ABC transporter ATP-binding protein [Candidatus Heimdallarchaeota archaeon]